MIINIIVSVDIPLLELSGTCTIDACSGTTDNKVVSCKFYESIG